MLKWCMTNWKTERQILLSPLSALVLYGLASKKCGCSSEEKQTLKLLKGKGFISGKVIRVGSFWIAGTFTIYRRVILVEHTVNSGEILVATTTSLVRV